MMLRKTLIVASVAVVALVSAVLVHAAPKQDSYPLDRQFVGLLGPATTTATEYHAISNWGFSDGAVVEARGAIAVELNVTVRGGPARFRVVMEMPERDWATRTLQPRSVPVDPGASVRSFSYTFVSWVPAGPYTINLFWKSPTGAEVTLTQGTVVIQYAHATRA